MKTNTVYGKEKALEVMAALETLGRSYNVVVRIGRMQFNDTPGKIDNAPVFVEDPKAAASKDYYYTTQYTFTEVENAGE